MTEAPAKPQWHWSHIETQLMCGKRYDYGYQQGKRALPGVAAATGSIVHAVAARNLKRKAATLEYIGLEELADLTRDTFRLQWEGGVHLLPDEVLMGLPRVQGIAIDRSIALAKIHAERIAPLIRPTVGGIEKPWVVSADGFPWDLAGEIDVEEVREYAPDGETILFPSSIRDLKTTGKRPTEKLVGGSGQLSMYSIAYQAFHGSLPDRVFFDYAMAKDSGEPDAGSFGSVRRPEHIEAFWETLESCAKAIEKQVFLPSRPNVDWWCTEKWCGFARVNPDTGVPICKHFYSAPTFVALSFNGGNGASNGNGKRRATVDESQSLILDL